MIHTVDLCVLQKHLQLFYLCSNPKSKYSFLEVWSSWPSTCRRTNSTILDILYEQLSYPVNLCALRKIWILVYFSSNSKWKYEFLKFFSSDQDKFDLAKSCTIFNILTKLLCHPFDLRVFHKYLQLFCFCSHSKRKY